MYLSLIILPLLGSITSGFFGRKIGHNGSQIITISSILGITILSLILFMEVGFNSIPLYLIYFPWIQSETLDIFWSFNFDSLTVSMLIPVSIVSVLVHLYSVGYMSHDPHVPRFFSYLSLFTFMMVILMAGSSYLVMFVGWEGVGICSYLLVNFWFTRIAANQSSVSALLTNRVGDCFLTIGMFVLLTSFGNLEYSTIFSLSPFMDKVTVDIAGSCILIGAMAKSSQVGLHAWLPMAMEGPTPVSALIHAATMVTAGVYLLMRSSPLIEYSSLVLLLCLCVGGITTIFSSVIGFCQQDIKKVIAYSTMSQLGMMVIAIGLSSYAAALFHLMNHAFYKALLFLSAGAVIHAVADNQDFRKYGGLVTFLPLTYAVMLIGSLSLVAFPFMTGFYSKDFILESCYGMYDYYGTVIYYIAVIGAMFTTLYSIKVLYLTFLAKPAGPAKDYNNAHEGDLYISTPLIILAFFSIYFGLLSNDIYIGLGTPFFSDNGLFTHPRHEITIDTEFGVATFFKLLPFVSTITLTVISLTMFEFLRKWLISILFTSIGYNTFSFFNQRAYVELFYNNYIIEPILRSGGQTTKVLDKGSVEYVGPYGLEEGFTGLSSDIDKMSTHTVTTYATYILISMITILLVPLFVEVMVLVLLGLGVGFSIYNRKIVHHHAISNLNSNLPWFNLSELKNKLSFLINKFKTKPMLYFDQFKTKFFEKHHTVKGFVIKMVVAVLTGLLVRIILIHYFKFDMSDIISMCCVNGIAIAIVFMMRVALDIGQDIIVENAMENTKILRIDVLNYKLMTGQFCDSKTIDEFIEVEVDNRNIVLGVYPRKKALEDFRPFPEALDYTTNLSALLVGKAVMGPADTEKFSDLSGRTVFKRGSGGDGNLPKPKSSQYGRHNTQGPSSPPRETESSTTQQSVGMTSPQVQQSIEPNDPQLEQIARDSKIKSMIDKDIWVKAGVPVKYDHSRLDSSSKIIQELAREYYAFDSTYYTMQKSSYNEARTWFPLKTVRSDDGRSIQVLANFPGVSFFVDQRTTKVVPPLSEIKDESYQTPAIIYPSAPGCVRPEIASIIFPAHSYYVSLGEKVRDISNTLSFPVHNPQAIDRKGNIYVNGYDHPLVRFLILRSHPAGETIPIIPEKQNISKFQVRNVPGADSVDIASLNRKSCVNYYPGISLTSFSIPNKTYLATEGLIEFIMRSERTGWDIVYGPDKKPIHTVPTMDMTSYINSRYMSVTNSNSNLTGVPKNQEIPLEYGKFIILKTGINIRPKVYFNRERFDFTFGGYKQNGDIGMELAVTLGQLRRLGVNHVDSAMIGVRPYCFLRLFLTSRGAFTAVRPEKVEITTELINSLASA